MQKIETVYQKVVRPPTVFDAWRTILGRHPQISKIIYCDYTIRPHGQHDKNRWIEALPKDTFVAGLDSWWANNCEHNAARGIGPVVEVLPDGYDATLDYQDLGRWLDGDVMSVEDLRQPLMAFSFIDFELPASPYVLKIAIQALRSQEKWWLLDSGGSYHVILEELVKPLMVADRCGQVLIDMAETSGMNPSRAKLCYLTGEHLRTHWADVDEMLRWKDDALAKFGHWDEPIGNKQVWPIDIRHLAMEIWGIVTGTLLGGFLRLSAKYGSEPVVVAHRNKNPVIIYDAIEYPFERRQLSLPEPQ